MKLAAFWEALPGLPKFLRTFSRGCITGRRIAF
jgi:hypothetical protein